MHILEEWRIRGIEQKTERATSRLYELDTIKNDVGSLEHTVRELNSLVNELRSQLQVQENKLDIFINESTSL